MFFQIPLPLSYVWAKGALETDSVQCVLALAFFVSIEVTLVLELF